jgi:hypothetical protein
MGGAAGQGNSSLMHLFGEQEAAENLFAVFGVAAAEEAA